MEHMAMKDYCLEQVAAHIGHEPWGNFCAMKAQIAEL